MQIDVSLAIAAIGITATIVSLISVMKKDNRNDGLLQGQLSNDIKHVRIGIDNISLEQKDQAREQIKLREAFVINQNDTARALENAERAYKHANEAHSRINKIGKGE
jgi:hypothetical protein